MDYREHIESNTHILLGKPVIKGTRITVALVLQRLSEGCNKCRIGLCFRCNC
ncbi:DUF433 domain-containing protein [Chitinophaga sp. 22321]|uniref:DUF433 domain-containing protein n=1 Tax=Chitinophaga hostae TaxID=2831022 RepID=A0ABS5J0L6_9BACT|nr:DUF433 domain-containing protein [Chitinophaga hostae]